MLAGHARLWPAPGHSTSAAKISYLRPSGLSGTSRTVNGQTPVSSRLLAPSALRRALENESTEYPDESSHHERDDDGGTARTLHPRSKARSSPDRCSRRSRLRPRSSPGSPRVTTTTYRGGTRREPYDYGSLTGTPLVAVRTRALTASRGWRTAGTVAESGASVAKSQAPQVSDSRGSVLGRGDRIRTYDFLPPSQIGSVGRGWSVVDGGYVTGLGEREARWRLITTTIEGPGTITNRCVRGADHAKANFLPPQLAKILGKDRAI